MAVGREYRPRAVLRDGRIKLVYSLLDLRIIHQLSAVRLYSTTNSLFAIRLPANIERRLDRLAKRTGRTKTYYVREAVIECLADLEAVYLAERRLEGIRARRRKTVPIEKVMRRYGVGD
jgi:RHH-type rel operon transcriptional repressor/antitoxin RelB